MKASELRIGNLVEFTDFPAKGVVRLDDEKLAYALTDPKWLEYFCKPIPLTEEWLLKFGFVNDIKPNLYYFGEISTIIGDDGSISNVYLNEYKHESSLYVPCKYVHQLQNLYFTLTGEELTYK